ncbi:MAG: transcription antitermination factor NusB [Elusimicrobiaceae bacterium]|nr:transcription antitermination factor NusB [Elusimicrobiaceae bacterium]
MSKRRLAREYALQTLYIAEAASMSVNEAGVYVNNFYNNLEEDTFPFCKDLVTGTFANQNKIDKILSSYATNWSVDRMSSVDRCILRMATYELVFSSDKAHVAAIIDEAIELSKKYSTDKSGKFINGLLDRIKAERKNG